MLDRWLHSFGHSAFWGPNMGGLGLVALGVGAFARHHDGWGYGLIGAGVILVAIGLASFFASLVKGPLSNELPVGVALTVAEQGSASNAGDVSSKDQLGGITAGIANIYTAPPKTSVTAPLDLTVDAVIRDVAPYQVTLDALFVPSRPMHLENMRVIIAGSEATPEKTTPSELDVLAETKATLIFTLREYVPRGKRLDARFVVDFDGRIAGHELSGFYPPVILPGRGEAKDDTHWAWIAFTNDSVSLPFEIEVTFEDLALSDHAYVAPWRENNARRQVIATGGHGTGNIAELRRRRFKHPSLPALVRFYSTANAEGYFERLIPLRSRVPMRIRILRESSEPLDLGIFEVHVLAQDRLRFTPRQSSQSG